MYQAAANAKMPHQFPHDKRYVATIVLSRLLLGLASGLVVLIANLYRDGSEPNFIASFVSVLVLAAAITYLHNRIPEAQSIFLPIIPLFGCGIIVAPMIGVPITHLALAFSSIVWLCWMAHSSTYLACIKSSLSWGMVLTVCVDRSVFIIARAIGGSLIDVRVFDASLLSMTSPFYCACIILFAIVLGTTVSFLIIASDQELSKIKRSVLSDTKEDYAVVYDIVAKKYALTKREREVLGLLAAGHSRSFIQDTLFISENTVRSHIRSIYKKLGCNRAYRRYFIREECALGEAFAASAPAASRVS